MDVVWKRTMHQIKHRFGVHRDIEIVGRAELVQKGDIVTRGERVSE